MVYSRQPPSDGPSLSPFVPPSLRPSAFRPRPSLTSNLPSPLSYSNSAPLPSLASSFSLRTSLARGPRKSNPFEELSAPKFDEFVDDVTSRIRAALLGPPKEKLVIKAKEAEEQEEEQVEEKAEDVFGQVVAAPQAGVNGRVQEDDQVAMDEDEDHHQPPSESSSPLPLPISPTKISLFNPPSPPSDLADAEGEPEFEEFDEFEEEEDEFDPEEEDEYEEEEEENSYQKKLKKFGYSQPTIPTATFSQPKPQLQPSSSSSPQSQSQSKTEVIELLSSDEESEAEDEEEELAPPKPSQITRTLPSRPHQTSDDEVSGSGSEEEEGEDEFEVDDDELPELHEMLRRENEKKKRVEEERLAQEIIETEEREGLVAYGSEDDEEQEDVFEVEGEEHLVRASDTSDRDGVEEEHDEEYFGENAGSVQEDDEEEEEEDEEQPRRRRRHTAPSQSPEASPKQQQQGSRRRRQSQQQQQEDQYELEEDSDGEPRIPWAAKGKGRAPTPPTPPPPSPTPSTISTISTSSLSTTSSRTESRQFSPPALDELFDYEIDELKMLIGILKRQIRKAGRKNDEARMIELFEGMEACKEVWKAKLKEEAEEEEEETESGEEEEEEESEEEEEEEHNPVAEAKLRVLAEQMIRMKESGQVGMFGAAVPGLSFPEEEDRDEDFVLDEEYGLERREEEEERDQEEEDEGEVSPYFDFEASSAAPSTQPQLPTTSSVPPNPPTEEEVLDLTSSSPLAEPSPPPRRSSPSKLVLPLPSSALPPNISPEDHISLDVGDETEGEEEEGESGGLADGEGRSVFGAEAEEKLVLEKPVVLSDDDDEDGMIVEDAEETKVEPPSPRVHNVINPGAWDPSTPIRFGASAATTLPPFTNHGEEEEDDDDMTIEQNPLPLESEVLVAEEPISEYNDMGMDVEDFGVGVGEGGEGVDGRELFAGVGVGEEFDMFAPQPGFELSTVDTAPSPHATVDHLPPPTESDSAPLDFSQFLSPTSPPPESETTLADIFMSPEQLQLILDSAQQALQSHSEPSDTFLPPPEVINSDLAPLPSDYSTLPTSTFPPSSAPAEAEIIDPESAALLATTEQALSGYPLEEAEPSSQDQLEMLIAAIDPEAGKAEDPISKEIERGLEELEAMKAMEEAVEGVESVENVEVMESGVEVVEPVVDSGVVVPPIELGDEPIVVEKLDIAVEEGLPVVLPTNVEVPVDGETFTAEEALDAITSPSLLTADPAVAELELELAREETFLTPHHPLDLAISTTVPEPSTLFTSSPTSPLVNPVSAEGEDVEPIKPVDLSVLPDPATFNTPEEFSDGSREATFADPLQEDIVVEPVSQEESVEEPLKPAAVDIGDGSDVAPLETVDNVPPPPQPQSELVPPPTASPELVEDIHSTVVAPESTELDISVNAPATGQVDEAPADLLAVALAVEEGKPTEPEPTSQAVEMGSVKEEGELVVEEGDLSVEERELKEDLDPTPPSPISEEAQPTIVAQVPEPVAAVEEEPELDPESDIDGVEIIMTPLPTSPLSSAPIPLEPLSLPPSITTDIQHFLDETTSQQEEVTQPPVEEPSTEILVEEQVASSPGDQETLLPENPSEDNVEERLEEVAPLAEAPAEIELNNEESAPQQEEVSESVPLEANQMDIDGEPLAVEEEVVEPQAVQEASSEVSVPQVVDPVVAEEESVASTTVEEGEIEIASEVGGDDKTEVGDEVEKVVEVEALIKERIEESLTVEPEPSEADTEAETVDSQVESISNVSSRREKSRDRSPRKHADSPAPRRSTRLSVPADSPASSPAPSSSAQPTLDTPSSRAKRPRPSDLSLSTEPLSPVAAIIQEEAEPAPPKKKRGRPPRKSVANVEPSPAPEMEPSPASTTTPAARPARKHHHHHRRAPSNVSSASSSLPSADPLVHSDTPPSPVGSTTSTGASTTASQTASGHLPVTRSHCTYTRISIVPPSNPQASPYVFLIPSCALATQAAEETMEEIGGRNLGPAGEVEEMEGTHIGGDDESSDDLIHDEEVRVAIRRIVGTDLWTEGVCEILSREESIAQRLRSSPVKRQREGDLEEDERERKR